MVLVVEAGEVVVGGVVVAGGGVVAGVGGLVAGVAGVGGVASEHVPGLAGGHVAGCHIAAVAVAHPVAHPVATVLAVHRGRVDRGGGLDHRLVGQGLRRGGRQGQGREQEQQHGGGVVRVMVRVVVEDMRHWWVVEPGALIAREPGETSETQGGCGS